jgi:electron transport complex protein RnfG
MTDVDLTISAQQKEPGAPRLVATLAVAGLLSGAALSAVYQVTDPIIQRNQAEALRRAVFVVVPGAETMQEVQITNDAGASKMVYAAYDHAGAFLGYAIEGQAPGFADTITLLYGYDPARQRVIGMEVLESLETPGLGDKIKREKNPAFPAQFENLAIEPEIIVVKDGRDAENEIDAITGATISTKAVVKAINIANESWLAYLPATPPPPPPPETGESASEEGEESVGEGD